MRLESLLESHRGGMIVLVDFQPAYHSGDYGYEDALRNACEYINGRNVKVLAFFNGMDVGIEDDEDEVIDHYVEEGGLDENSISNFQLIEKYYAFLRGWMDQGVSDRAIIQTIRYMAQQKTNNSRDIEEEVLQKITGEDYNEDVMQSDPIFIPDINLRLLREMNGCMIGGGGRHECLRELTLLMNAFNIKYKLVNDWIYG